MCQLSRLLATASTAVKALAAELEHRRMHEWLSNHVYRGLPKDVLLPGEVHDALAQAGIVVPLQKVQDKMAKIFVDDVSVKTDGSISFLGLRLNPVA